MHRLEKGGPERRQGGCGRTLGGASLHRLCRSDCWMGLGFIYVGARPRFVGCFGLCLVLLYRICITLCMMAYFDNNSLVFKYESAKQ